MQEVEAKKARGDAADGRTDKRRVAGPDCRVGEAIRIEENRDEPLYKVSESMLYMSRSAAAGVKLQR
jgi:hypothetical protein